MRTSEELLTRDWILHAHLYAAQPRFSAAIPYINVYSPHLTDEIIKRRDGAFTVS